MTPQQLLAPIFDRDSAPGNRLIENLPFTDYQSLAGINASLLKNPTAYEMLACLIGMSKLDGLDRMLAEMSGDRAQEIMERVERSTPRKVPVKLVSLVRPDAGYGKLTDAQAAVVEALEKGPQDSRQFNGATLTSLDKKGFLDWSDTERDEVEVTPAQKESKVQNFTIGTVTHAAILEPNLFDSDEWQKHWVLSPTKQLTTGLALECAAENPGKTLVTPEIIDVARRCRDAVWKVDLAAKLLSKGKSEVTGQAWDEEAQAWRKIRIDWLPADPADGVLDIKTCRASFSDYSLRSEVYKFQYHLQSAAYLDTLAMIEGKKREQFHICWVTKSAPFMARCTELNTAPADENFVAQGRELFYNRLIMFVQAYLDNSFPAYEHEGLVTLRAKQFNQ